MQTTPTSDALVDSRADRDRHAGRVDALDKVKALMLLPDGTHVTVDMAAAYYEVPADAVEKHLRRPKIREELESDGLHILAGPRLSAFKAESGYQSRAATLTLLPKRAVLRLGMLLRDSPIAQQVRTQLLDDEEQFRAAPAPAPRTPAVPDIREPEVAVEVLGQMLELAKTAAAQARELESTRPKASFVDKFVNPTDDATLIRIFAQQVGMAERELRTWMQDRKLIYKRFVERRWSGSKRKLVDEYEWLPRATHAAWFVVRDQPTAERHHNGQVRTTLYVSALGKEKIRALLAKQPAAIEAAPSTRALEAS